MNIDIERLTKEAFDNIIKEAAKDVIVAQLGHGIETEVKLVLKDRAEELLRGDEEINLLLKDRLRHWITQQ
jgi:hypothetical protein